MSSKTVARLRSSIGRSVASAIGFSCSEDLSGQGPACAIKSNSDTTAGSSGKLPHEKVAGYYGLTPVHFRS